MTTAGVINVNGGSILTAAGNLSLQPAGAGVTANVQIGAGGLGSVTPDLLVLDIKSNAGDPAGTNGAMYYNASTSKMRCFQAGSWADCGSGSSGSSNWILDDTNGIIYPISKTVDVLFGTPGGSTATASAKFAFTGIDGGLPTASISGNISNVATFITGNGDLSTTNRRNLIIGNSTSFDSTGNTLFNPNGTGNVGIGISVDPLTRLTINGDTTATLKSGFLSTDSILLSQLEGGSFFGKVGITENQFNLSSFGSGWSSTASSQSWNRIAVSSDGKYQAAIISVGQIYESTDYGANWTAVASSQDWRGIAMSADGKIQAATVFGGQIYESTDYGANWNAHGSSLNYTGIAISTDGKIQTAIVSNDGNIYRSRDYGVNWSAITVSGSPQAWSGVTLSSDGKIQLAVSNGGLIYQSTDYGSSWATRDIARNWFAVALSQDGKIAAATVSGGQIYESTDYGVTWGAKASSLTWRDIAISADGKIQEAAAFGDQIWLSTDFGNNWAATATVQNWYGIALSSDAKAQVATINTGNIFRAFATSNSEGNIAGPASGTVGYWSRSGTTLSPATANDIVSIASNTTTNPLLTLTLSGSPLTTAGAISSTGASYDVGAGNTGNLINLSLTDAGTNTSGNSDVNGIGIATTLNASGVTGTKEFDAIDVAAPTITGCSGGNCAWSGLKVNTVTSGPLATLTNYGVNIVATGIGAGSLTGLNISGITAGAGAETGLAIGSGWDTDLALASTTPKVSIGNTGTLAITDGTNNLFTLADAGTTGNGTFTGNLAIQGGTLTTNTAVDLTINPNGGHILAPLAVSLNVGGIAPVGYNAFAGVGDAAASIAITTSNDLFVGGDLEVKGGLYLTGKNIFNVVGGVSTGTITLAADPTLINNFNSLAYGSWLVQNTANPGIAALMVDQRFNTPDIFDASASGTLRFSIANNGDVKITSSHNSSTSTLTVSDTTGTGTGKIDVGTVDPPYTINGTKYATFLSGMVGQKEEVTGSTNTSEYVPGVGYRSVIDFNSLPQGSDLWLFSKATDIKNNIGKLVALLTPSDSTQTWYQVDATNAKLAIYSARPTTISFRLTGPRFDYLNFPNQRPDNSESTGFVLNMPDVVNNSPIVTTVENLSAFFWEKVDGGAYILKNSSGTVIDGIISIGNFVAANIKAGAIITKDFAAENINAAVATIDNLTAKNLAVRLISPVPGDTNVTVQIGSDATPSGQFVVQNASGSAVASIDNSGNATFSGTIASQSVNTDNASISGTLVADNIQSLTIDQIKSQLNQVVLDQNLLTQAANWNVNTATGSAKLDSLAVTDLYVTNQGAFNSLSVTNNLSIGTDMVVGSGTIDTLSAPLSIQSLAMAPIRFMAGLVSIDTHGNVNISGDLLVAGRINASGLTLKDSVNESTPSAQLLSLQDSTGTDVATVNASGSAAFSSIYTPQVVIAAPDATASGTIIDGVITTNSTIGKAVVPAGTSEITIKNPKVTDYTLVYVTPTSSTDNYVLYVKSKSAGQFVVGFTNPINVDVNFNWWLIDTRLPNPY